MFVLILSQSGEASRAMLGSGFARLIVTSLGTAYDALQWLLEDILMTKSAIFQPMSTGILYYLWCGDLQLQLYPRVCRFCFQATYSLHALPGALTLP